MSILRKGLTLLLAVGIGTFATWLPGHPISWSPDDLVWAEVPQLIAYQGVLSETAGGPLVGEHTLTFRLYNTESGGSKLWEEAHRVNLLKEDDGTFSITLGSVTTFGTLDFNQPLWISIEVDGDGEMTPRLRLTAVGYAINADKLDSLDSSSFLRADVDTATSGKLTITRAGTALLIKPSTDPVANTKLLDIQNAAGTSKFSVDLEGDVTAAGEFSASGTNVMNLNASNLASGTVPDARLSTNVSLLGPTIESGEVTDGTLTSADLAQDSVGAEELKSDAIQSGDIEVGDLPNLARTSTASSSSTTIGTTDTTLLSVTVNKVSATSALLIIASVALSHTSGGGTTVNVKLRRDGSLLDGAYTTRIGKKDAGELKEAIVTIHAWDPTTSGSHTIDLVASAGDTGSTATVRRLTVAELL